MVRREMVGGGLLAGLTALFVPTSVSASDQSNQSGERIADAIDEFRREFIKAQECTLGQCPHVEAIRRQQNVFLKANQKFPDFIDAGYEVWEAVYDWHVRNRLQINSTRLPDGRHGIVFMFTTVVLRPENTPNFLGLGYDAR